MLVVSKLIGVRVSQQPLQFDGRILSVPFYMVGELPRLVGATLCSGQKKH